MAVFFLSSIKSFVRKEKSLVKRNLLSKKFALKVVVFFSVLVVRLIQLLPVMNPPNEYAPDFVNVPSGLKIGAEG